MYANLFYKHRRERTTFFLTDPRNRLFISSIRCSNYQIRITIVFVQTSKARQR